MSSIAALDSIDLLQLRGPQHANYSQLLSRAGQSDGTSTPGRQKTSVSPLIYKSSSKAKSLGSVVQTERMVLGPVWCPNSRSGPRISLGPVTLTVGARCTIGARCTNSKNGPRTSLGARYTNSKNGSRTSLGPVAQTVRMVLGPVWGPLHKQ